LGTIPAKGYWASSWEYYQNYCGQLPGLEYHVCYPGYEVTYRLPHTIHTDIHPCFSQRAHRQIPETYWLTVPEGTILRAYRSMGSVVAHDGRVIHDSSRQCGLPVAENEALHLKFPTTRAVDHTIAVMTDGGGGINYWHWLFDILPKFYLMQKEAIWPKIDYFLVDKPLPQLQITLDILGISKEQIMYTKFSHSLKCPLVVLPNYIREKPRWILDFLRSSFLPRQNLDVSSNKKIYISRRKAKRRKIANEDQVLDYLTRRGYTAYCLEDLSFSEQISLFRNAKYVIGLHGAGLTNIAWCEPGGRVLEIFPDVPRRDCYWILANQVGLDYYYWYPTSQNGSYDADIWIDTRAFAQVVDHFES
ncbi:MAG: glycosyltransferase family 61 protein, partial [Gloeomargarita sp. SKYBB_i_bin120]|nr:glycosyltransferase family 61 protein [Gloeomargarita sp. SKYB120]MDW8179121.1 glycosyltransferase family 61 protein [Gloeomargarita sp. SKYBB_i_bin120]